MAYNVPKQIVVISSSNINLKATGNTIIFTPATAFVVTAIIAYGVSLTGSISVPIANIGFTGPNYDDIVSGFTNFSNATGFLYEGNALGLIPLCQLQQHSESMLPPQMQPQRQIHNESIS